MRTLIVAAGAAALMTMAATGIMIARATSECVGPGAVAGRLLDLLPQAGPARRSDIAAEPSDASARSATISSGAQRDEAGPRAGVVGLVNQLIAPATKH